jgi:hypothetical protein
MKQAIATLRFLGMLISGVAIVAIVSLGLPVTTAMGQMTHAPTVKTWLTNSNVYPYIVEAALQQTLTEIYQNVSDVPTLYSQELATAYHQRFPMASMKAGIESALDTIYASLHGNDVTLVFSTDVDVVDSFLRNDALTILQTHIKAMPQCSEPGRFGQSSPNTCIPDTVNRADLLQRINQYWVAKVADSFSTSIDSFDLNHASLTPIRRFFRVSRTVRQIFVLSLLLFVMMHVLTRRDRPTGIRGAVSFWTIGVIIACTVTGVAGTVGNWLINAAQVETGGDQSAELFFNVVKAGYFSIFQQVAWVGLLGIGIGWTGAIAAQRLSPNHPHP